jgi:hypothetical protein
MTDFSLESILTSKIAINIKENQETLISLTFIVIILIANVSLVAKRWGPEKNNKEYIHFYDELYHDFLKYLCIEIALVVAETIEKKSFRFISSLARISIVLLSLLFFHSIKDKIGIN